MSGTPATAGAAGAARARAGTLPVTVAVLNHRRPHLLARVLVGVMQLDHPAFEIVVVGDRPALSDYALPAQVARAVRYFRCDEPNICRARNIAVGQAAGEIVAFCDDDAVPEPDWLARLAAPFADPAVGAVGGVVRAADGLGLEWAGGAFDRTAAEHPQGGDVPVQVFTAEAQVARGRFLALRGVNSAFRRAAVHRVGGFDEAFRYYLDETDMAIRLAGDGWSAALVRGAEVQHLPEQNVARGALRQPRDLFEIGASKAYFCRRHMPAAALGAELARFRAARLRELDPHLRLGLLRLADRDRLARRLAEGIADGLMRAPVLPLHAAPAQRRFAAVEPTGARLSVALVTGWGPIGIARLRAVARRLAGAGHRVSCFSYFTGLHAPSLGYRDGVWLHAGGTWRPGRTPEGRLVFGRDARARAEMARIAERRRFNVVLRPASAADARNAGSGGALLAVPGVARPLKVELARDCGMGLAEIVIELRRVIDQPRQASAEAEAAGAAAAGAAAMPVLLPGSPVR